MEKILSIYNFLKETLWHSEQDEAREYIPKEFKLSKKIDIRVTPGEYEIIIKMCELHNISISEYFRNLNMTYIDKFIIESDVEKQYNNVLERRIKYKKVC